MASVVGRWGYPVVAVVLAGLGTTQLLTEPDEHLLVTLPAMLVGALGVSVLRVGLARRSLLVGMLLILAAAVTVQFVAGTPPFALFLATMTGVYALARHGDRRTVLLGFGAVLATFALLAASQIGAGTDGPFGIVIILVYWGVVAGAGWAARHRAAYTRLVGERAAALEREREHLAELAAAAERARLAREVHDVVAHGVSLLVLQAEAAREVLASRPEQAAVTLDAMADTGRRAVADLRHMLGLLRDPQPAGAGDLHTLLTPVRLAGLSVTLVGDPGQTPQPLRPTVYRLVQEALTNVVKHAGAHAVTVTLERSATVLTVDVLDDGRGTGPGGGSGRGVAGMAERVAELGGTFTAGAGAGGGFRVHAELPCDPATIPPRDGRAVGGGRVIRVLLADDQELVRAGLRMILEAQDDIEVVADVGDAVAAVRECLHTRPDVALLDIRMPGDGLVAARDILANPRLDTRVIMLTTFDLDEYLYGALSAGASGFLLKSSPRAHLLHAVRTAATGDALLDPVLTRRLIERYLHWPAARDTTALATLTGRERDVLRELVRGRSNAEIATGLYLAETTVKTHVAAVLRKLGLRDRLQAVIYGYESGLIRAGEPDA